MADEQGVPRAHRRPQKGFLQKDALTWPDYRLADVMAVKAMHDGVASPHQQRLAFDWILKKLGGIGALSFDPDNARATDFREGRRYVAAVMLGIAESSSAQLRAGATDRDEDHKQTEQPEGA